MFRACIPGQPAHLYGQSEGSLQKKTHRFSLTPHSVMPMSSMHKDRMFLFRGHLDSCVCWTDAPLTGQLVLEESVRPVASVELQLVRVESTLSSGGRTESSEVQSIQVVDGDVVRGLEIPLHMHLPKHFVCASVELTENKTFAVGFELNVIVMFRDNRVVVENISLTLHRGP